MVWVKMSSWIGGRWPSMGNSTANSLFTTISGSGWTPRSAKISTTWDKNTRSCSSRSSATSWSTLRSEHWTCWRTKTKHHWQSTSQWPSTANRLTSNSTRISSFWISSIGVVESLSYGIPTSKRTTPNNHLAMASSKWLGWLMCCTWGKCKWGWRCPSRWVRGSKLNCNPRAQIK